MSQTVSQTYLSPVSQPVALFDDFIARDPQQIILKEKIFSLSGDSFDIKVADGTPLLNVNGNRFSFTGRKKVEDLNGKHLFDIRKEHMHLHTTYLMEDPAGNKICEVRSSHKFIGSKATAVFYDHYNKETTLIMEGNWSDHTATIVNEGTGQSVARISRKRFNPRHIIFGQDTYRVTVAPGVDMALIAGLCICFDEKNND
ncbi:hypothetical protein N7541_005358 [Penicillium brevicompactum]|uniref:Tubby C-terminal-like domain-containing protein n=1 Tax=Penicillium brevicompactum TaxID=5074 RepID=A0A9W9RES0_PENBR|nr:hypothetical protein N7541_005358 [Penicillium brevicompactum]